MEYVVRRNRFHEFEIWEEERASEFYDLNYDNRYEDKYDKMLRKRDPSLDIPLTHLSNCSGDVFKLRFVFTLSKNTLTPVKITLTPTKSPLLRPNHPYLDRMYPKYEFVIFRDELVEFLESVSNEPLAGRADEVEGKITVTGKFYDFVEDFLYERGF